MKFPFMMRSTVSAVPNLLSRPKPVRRKKGVSWLFLAPFMLLACFIGMVGGLDSPQLVVIIGSAVLSLILFFLLSINGLFVCLLFLTLIVQGCATYFLGLRSATWVAFGMALMFFFRGALDLVQHRRAVVEKVRGESAPTVIAACLYLLCFVVSLVFNRVPAAQMLSAVKAALPMFSVLFCFYWFNWSEQNLQRTWHWLGWVLLIQFPVVAYQHFFVADARTFDSIVGTFGGTPGGGGNSAVMVFFTVIMMVYALARWDAGVLSFKKLSAVFLLGFAIILLGEVKAAFIWVPLSSAWVLRRRLLKSVFTLVAYLAVICVFMGATYLVYNALYWGKSVERHNTVAEKLSAGGGYFFDPNNVNYLTGEISRGASLAIWWHDPNSSLPRRLIGYGPGASKPTGLLGVGEVAKRYAPLHLDATTLAILLWDVGVLGALAYCAMPVCGLIIGLRYLARGGGDAATRAQVETIVAALILFLSMLIYNRAMADEPTCQLMYMICLGGMLQIYRYHRHGVARVTTEAPRMMRPGVA